MIHAERVSNNAFDSVPFGRLRRHSPRDCDPQPRMLQAVTARVNGERGIGALQPTAKDVSKLA